ncbi:DivIVA domain-containing protein [Convivina intestini]|uniref:DivIVA domain-containing protein n=1 Tax=Convivina intestini TaxID=1505726 RepID=A0A2U1DC24_9LACO|nr:DivIVA domain-containing protein [Convivina intestini]PVY85217.1 DivIVA domain-containing protein [Convivina intestini]CAH1852466.1 Cell cycle protein GpsB [Convivina intestini]CAH1854595.1 Cell cycle protein GpsB [Convivina intestini]SDC01072.1 DivIVA domain-containing protein [Leuconostocaceae bacterium R-53105]
MAQVKYTQKDIYERVFKQRRMGVGYDPQDVDDFLDGVISDYGVFNDQIEQLQGEVAKLQDALRAAQKQLVTYQNSGHISAVTAPQESEVERPRSVVAEESTTQAQPQAAVVNSVDTELLKRVANLELAVFGRERSDKNQSGTNRNR